MRGAVAAGHPLTAQAGADVLAAGGNAVDAAVGAALVSWVAESPLTGPGSGGFMLVHRARDRSTRVFDFCGGSTQVFHIGAASCAVRARLSAWSRRTAPSAGSHGATSSNPRSTSRE